jgi:hypothetical protein
MNRSNGAELEGWLIVQAYEGPGLSPGQLGSSIRTNFGGRHCAEAERSSITHGGLEFTGGG